MNAANNNVMSAAESQFNRRILIVDDNAAIHNNFQKILVAENAQQNSPFEEMELMLGARPPSEAPMLGFEISSAFQGKEALELVQCALAEGYPFALAFVDMHMPPGWSGIETIAHLWRCDPELQVVICTAYSDYSWGEIVQQLGTTDSLLILKKPFDNVEVMQLAHALTRKWNLARQDKNHRKDLERIVQQRTGELEEAIAKLHKVNDNLRKEMAEREVVQHSLRLSEERFAKAFSSSPIPLAIQTLKEERFLDANRSFLQTMGFTRNEILAVNPEKLRLFRDNDQRIRLLDSLRKTASVRQQECKLRAKSGNFLDTLVSMELFELGAEPCILLIVQDITDQRNMENQLRQAQKMEAIGHLAAGVAHDFNNLLTVIQGYVSLLLNDPGLAQDYTESLKAVSDAGERAASLVRQLLTFSRKQIVIKKLTDVNELFRNLTSVLRRLIGEHIQLDCEFEAGLPPVWCDPDCLEQVLLNLVVNARDAMPDGGCLTVRTSFTSIDKNAARRHPEAKPGEYICVTVMDTGAGMTQEVLSHIFEPFFTTKEIGKGTGLGLATAYGIIKHHEGWIEVTSSVGRGSTFCYYLPAHHQEISKAPQKTITTIPHGIQETILLVEDEATLRQMARTILEKHGYKVREAANAEEALKEWKQSPCAIDLLLTDVVMPGGMSGKALAEKIQIDRPELKVIYMSGYALDLAKEEFANQEKVFFLSKPFSITQLTQTIRSCLDGPPARS